MTGKTNLGKKILSIFLYTFLISLNEGVNAQSADVCQMNTDLRIIQWKAVPSEGGVFDGQIIGIGSAVTMFYYSGLEKKAFVDSRGVASYSFNAIPMPKTPGIGVRISWQGYWSHGGYSFKVDQQRPKGTYLSTPYLYNLLAGSAASSFIINYYFDYEIVVIDADKYRGGEPVFTHEADIKAMVYSDSVNGGRRLCNRGEIDLLDALVNDVTIPELPRPPMPTCSSTDIDQVITLPPVTVSQLAEYRSARSEGMTAEQRFELVGRRCPQGTKIMAFFTDARSSAEEKDYLESSHPSVGVRLYHRENQNPIRFGAAPIGSTMPNRPAVVENQPNSATSDIHLPLTAQYVIAPNVDRNSVVPGRLNAEAVVTFIYD